MAAKSAGQAALLARFWAGSEAGGPPTSVSFACSGDCPLLLPARDHCPKCLAKAECFFFHSSRARSPSSTWPGAPLSSAWGVAARRIFRSFRSYGGSCFAAQQKHLTSTSSDATALLSTTAATPQARQSNETKSHDTYEKECHPGVPIVHAALRTSPGLRKKGDCREPTGVLLLRRTPDRKCSSTLLRYDVPFVYNNEVQSITSLEGSDTLAGVGSACARTRTSEVTKCSTDQVSPTVCSDSGTPPRPAARHRGVVSRETSAEGSRGSNAEADRREGVDSGGLDAEVSGRTSCRRECSDDIKSAFAKRTPDSCGSHINGLIYIKDDEGTCYGIGYSPHDPHVAAWVLTQNVTETIDAEFFLRRMQTALRQRQALREVFDWWRWPGIINVSDSSSRAAKSNGVHNSAANTNGVVGSGSSEDALEYDNSSLLKCAGSSHKLNGGDGRSSAKGICDVGTRAAEGESVSAAVNAEGGVGHGNASTETPQSHTVVLDKQTSRNYFRLINSEGDFLPGLACDLYGQYGSILLLNPGIEFLLPLVVEALQRLLPLRGIVVHLDSRERLVDSPSQGTGARPEQQRHHRLKEMALQQRPPQQTALQQQHTSNGCNPNAANEGTLMQAAGTERSNGASEPLEPQRYLQYSLEGHFSMSSGSCGGPCCLSFGPVPDRVIVEENGCLFPIDLLRGDGTGWAYDRREFRQRVAFLSTGKRVLDIFCTSGGNAVTAMRLGNARECVGLCKNKRALDLALEARSLNGLSCDSSNETTRRPEEGIDTCLDQRQGRMGLVQADVSEWLAEAAESAPAERFDVVVFDPPSCAWRSCAVLRQPKRRQELMAYAARLTDDRGFLAVTCSRRHYHGGFAQFYYDLRAAVAAAGKTAILHGEGGSGADFPLDVGYPHGQQLLWVVLQLECR